MIIYIILAVVIGYYVYYLLLSKSENWGCLVMFFNVHVVFLFIFGDNGTCWKGILISGLVFLAGIYAILNGAAVPKEAEEAQRRREYERNKEEYSEKAERKKTELRAVRDAIEYERSCDRSTDDVSSDNKGYDLVSKGNEETRFIEVKGLAKGYSSDLYVYITENEWEKSKELKANYWLYVVFNCEGFNTDIYMVNDPASKFYPEHDYYNKKYKITASSIKDNANERHKAR